MQPLRLRYWWLSGGILLVVAVLYLTLMPVIGGIFTVNVNDKIGHFIAFFVLMAWFCGVYKRGRWLVIAVVLAAFGVAIELIQGQLSYRTAELADMVYDLAGIGAAWICAGLGFGQWALVIESRWFAPSG